MPFTVQDFHDLIRLVEQHPEWRAELRRLVLTEELLSLPGLVRELIEAQRLTEVRLAELAEAQRRTDERLAELAEAQRRTDERLGRVEEQVAALIEAQRLTEVRLAELAEAQRRTDERLAELAEAQRRTDERLGRVEEQVAALIEAQRLTDERLAELRGDNLERRYRERAGAYFGRLVRRAYALSDREIAELLGAAEEAGQLTPEEVDDVRAADVIVRGRRPDGTGEVYLVVEVSVGIGPGDVERALRRATLLQRALGPDRPTLPVVAGARATREAQSLAAAQDVWIILDGRAVRPEEEYRSEA
jgi:ribosomal protein S15P/S13E